MHELSTDDVPQSEEEVLQSWQRLTNKERRTLARLIARRHHIKNVNDLTDEQLSTGQRVADGVARVMGSWTFIIIQSVLLVSWIFVNALAWIHHWDPYPFILLNLALSFQAAYSAPIIMMSQNRQSMKDRIAAEHDYRVNLHAELDISEVRKRLDDLSGNQWNELVRLQNEQLQLLNRIEQLTTEVHLLATAASRNTTTP